MNEKMVSQIWIKHFSEKPDTIERCAVGQGNYVYIVENAGMKYVFRCSAKSNAKSSAYDNSIYWLEKLSSIEIPVPKVIVKGKYEE